MGTKYPGITISGYNSNPPPDDGTQAASNLVTWSGIKGKLGDPVKTAAQAIDSAVATALNLACRAVSSNDSTVAGDHWKTLELSNGATLTLLDAATAGAGYAVKAVNVGTTVCRITRATGGDFINGVAIDLNLNPGDSVSLKVNAAANGYVVDGGNNVDVGCCNGRLSASSTAVPTSDVSSSTSVFFVPYNGNKIALFDGTGTWSKFKFGSISVACPTTSSTPFDVFAFNNAGVVALETASWSNSSSRATGITFQDGVLVKVGATTRRYLGTCTTIATPGNIEDTAARRFVWNQYNFVDRPAVNYLGADVAINNASNFFDGPSVPVASAEGTYKVEGTVTCLDTAAASSFLVKLWDGTTVIAAGNQTAPAINAPVAITLSGYITSPQGNLRLSVKSGTTTGVIKFNTTGTSKDSSITATRKS